MRKLFVLLAVMLLAGAQLAWGQAVRISGTVTGAEDGMPMPGVSVVVKGTTTGTATDMDGRYTLSVPADAQTLVFSYIGYATQEVAIAGRTTIDVALESGSEDIEEIVVTAYGTAKKSSLVGASSAIKAEKLEARPLTSVTNALGGTVAGLQMTNATGQPGASSNVRIRGFGSVNASNAPLYVVDGAIFNGSISDINPNDIEVMTVLKDAASTALYGSSAGNGVILITTKRGNTTAGKPVITFFTNHGLSGRAIPEYDRVDVWDYYPVMWRQLYNNHIYNNNRTPEDAAARASTGVFTNLKYNPFRNVPDNEIVMADGTLNPLATELLYGDDLDWEKAITRRGYRQEYGLTANSHTEKTDVYSSMGYIKENGYSMKTFYERYSGRLNASYTANKWLRVGTNVSLIRVQSTAANTSSSTGYVNPFFFARGIGPIYPIHEHDAEGNYVRDDKGNLVYDYNKTRGTGGYSGRHIVAETELNDRGYSRDAANGRGFVEISPIDGLKFTTNVAYDISNTGYKYYTNRELGDALAYGGRLQQINTRSTTATLNQLLDYTKTFADAHNVSPDGRPRELLLSVQLPLLYQNKPGGGGLYGNIQLFGHGGHVIVH